MTKFNNAKDALANGEKFFESLVPCKRNHESRIRRIEVKNRWVSGRCVECEKESLERYKNKDDYAQRRQKTVKKWKPKQAEYSKEWKARKDIERPFYNLLSSIKSRATSRGIPFDLDEEYLASIIPPDAICPITLRKMVRGKKGTNKANWMSVDRIVPALGYTKGNVAIISHAANAMKQDCSDPAVFRRLADWIDHKNKY